MGGGWGKEAMWKYVTEKMFADIFLLYIVITANIIYLIFKILVFEVFLPRDTEKAQSTSILH